MAVLETVLPDLRAGKRIRRPSLLDVEIGLGRNKDGVVLVMLDGVNMIPTSFDIGDLLAEDWEVVT